jgi:hypothetical protein
MAKSAASPLRQCVALSGAKAKLRVGSAACPRALAPVFCLQFGLAFVCPDCLARLDCFVHLTLRPSSDRAILSNLTEIRKVEPRVGCADMGLGEAQLAAYDVAAFDQVARVRDDAARPPPRAQAAVGDPRSAIADVFEAPPLARVEQGGAGRRNVLGFEPGLAVRRKGVALQDRRHHVVGRPREAVQ